MVKCVEKVPNISVECSSRILLLFLAIINCVYVIFGYLNTPMFDLNVLLLYDPSCLLIESGTEFNELERSLFCIN